MVAVIIYRHSNDHWISRFLHRHVKHCFIAYLDRGRWVSVDYTLDGVRVHVSNKLPKGVYYQRVIIDKMKLSPVIPTCVGMVKHAIGIKNPFIFTPWQLLKSIHYGKQSEKA